jgi:hypothetical protein
VKARILRARRAIKELLDPLLGEHRASQSSEYAANAAHGFSAGTFAPALMKERMNFAPQVSLFDDFTGAHSVSAKEGKP